MDKENKIFRKKRKERKEKLILDFGDVYFLNQFTCRTKLFEMFDKKKNFSHSYSIAYAILLQ